MDTHVPLISGRKRSKFSSEAQNNFIPEMPSHWNFFYHLKALSVFLFFPDSILGKATLECLHSLPQILEIRIKLSAPRQLKATPASEWREVFPGKLPHGNFTHGESDSTQLLFTDVSCILKIL